MLAEGQLQRFDGEVYSGLNQDPNVHLAHAYLGQTTGKIYVTGNMGQVAVLAAGTDWEVLGVNQLGEDCSATPAIGADGLYIRTHSALFRFGRLQD